MNAWEIGHIGRRTTRSVSRECLCLVFTKTNNPWCGNSRNNRLDMEFDTSALTLMISTWELHFQRAIAGILLSLSFTHRGTHALRLITT